MRHHKLKINDDSHLNFFFVLYKHYMPIIFYQKHFFKFSLSKKILTFALRVCSICLVLSALPHLVYIIILWYIDDQTKMETFNPLNMWWWSCISAHSHFQHEEGGRKKGEKQMFTECICECWHLLTTHCSLDPLSWDCCWLKSQQLALLTVYYGQHTRKTQLKLFS